MTFPHFFINRPIFAAVLSILIVIAGAIAYPTPDEAASTPWGAADDALVADRLDTRFVGTAAQVADRLAALQEATAADELLVTTITHDHGDRVRSFQLLAKEWSQR